MGADQHIVNIMYNVVQVERRGILEEKPIAKAHKDTEENHDPMRREVLWFGGIPAAKKLIEGGKHQNIKERVIVEHLECSSMG